MATVTVYTADRMKDIEDAAIVSGVINGSGNLILSRFDGSTIDAGVARGATGAPGVTSGELTASLAGKLSTTGGTMTGHLSGITPTSAAHLTRKDYVDGLDAAQTAALVAKSGSTMTGHLSGITPTSAAHLTRKDYVDGLNTSQTNRIQAKQESVALSSVANGNYQFTVTFPTSFAPFAPKLPVVTFTVAADWDDPITGYQATIAYIVKTASATQFTGYLRSINSEPIDTPLLINWIAVIP